MTDNSTEQVGGADPGSGTIPPYIPFQTLLTFLKQLKADGLPPQIDKSVLSKFSGGTQGQLKVALRAMGLMDDNKPTPDLESMVEALETPEFQAVLLKLLHRTYPYVFALDLVAATPTMFADAFKGTGAKEDVSRKCRTFFLHAAKAAGVPLGNRILTGSVPRTSNGGTKRKPKTKAKPDPASDSNANDKGEVQQPKPDNGVLSQLLAKFPDFDPNWPDDIKAKWFAGFDQFMKGAKTK